MDFTKNKNKPKKQTKNPGYKYRISCDIHVIGENINRKNAAQRAFSSLSICFKITLLLV